MSPDDLIEEERRETNPLFGDRKLNSQSIPAPALAKLKEHFTAGWGGYPLVRQAGLG